MADAVYDVEARLTMAGMNRAIRQTVSLSSRLKDVGRKIQGVNRSSSGMIRNMLAVGGAYAGFRLLSNAITGLTRHTVNFSAELEKTKIGLGAVLSAVEGTTFEEGMKRGSKVFRELTEDAIKSTSTTMEMFRIYQNVLGPIRAAGFELDVVREITNKTVAAASALNVDFAQATRDIQLMVQGTAGMDTRLFAILRSTGAIREDTEAWNKSLTAQDRVEKLREALGKFTPAADAYAKSWVGLMSSFEDITEQLMATAAGPAFEAVKNFISGINDRMMANREALEGFLNRIGDVLGNRLDAIFTKANQGIDFMIANWDDVARRIQDVVNKVREITPMLVKAAAAYAAVNIGRTVVGGAVGVAGTVASVAEKIGPRAMVARGRIGARMADPLGTGAAMGMGLAPGWMMGAGGGGAAAGGAAAGAAGSAGGAAGVSALAVGLGALAVILTAVAGVVLIVQEQWAVLTEIFEQSTTGLGDAFMGLVKAIGGFLVPILKVVMMPLVLGLTAVFTVLTPLLTLMINGWRLIFEVLAYGVNVIYDLVKPAFDALFGFFQNLAYQIWQFLTKDIPGFLRPKAGYDEDAAAEERLRRGGIALGKRHMAEAERTEEEFMKDLAAQVGGPGGRGERFGDDPFKQVPKERPKVVNDFRGSKITVKQEFREADPDRVMIQMIDDINRQAEMRIRTGFAPALGG